MMVFFAVLLGFSSRTSKFRHSLTKKHQLLGTLSCITSHRTPTGALSLTPMGEVPQAASFRTF